MQFLLFKIVVAPQTLFVRLFFSHCMKWMRCFGGFERRDLTHPSPSDIPECVCFYVSFLFCFCSPGDRCQGVPFTLCFARFSLVLKDSLTMFLTVFSSHYGPCIFSWYLTHLKHSPHPWAMVGFKELQSSHYLGRCAPRRGAICHQKVAAP